MGNKGKIIIIIIVNNNVVAGMPSLRIPVSIQDDSS